MTEIESTMSGTEMLAKKPGAGEVVGDAGDVGGGGPVAVMKTEFVYADGAVNDVKLCGDWNNWIPVQMYYEGGEQVG